MRVIEYDKKYRQDFIDFNSAWIIDTFGHLEPEDYETFKHIGEEIQDEVMIYFAVDDNETALAACMSKPMVEDTWEICKWGSNKNVSHKGAVSAVFESAMEWAINHGAGRLFILSNSKLNAALHIYKKFGFKEITLDNYEYERGNIDFEKILK